ncbi:hypothetical protein [Marseilla massiliensis]|uniref:hypothetical protein n=1 Tax=Marseilla massiliensis TaxID=1841864 RepID=UPI0020117D1E|nr:hypothetical protein [Marseilla massiliensis]MCL1610910.1 hypothetical protein [Marseilla massiliensis]
MRTIRLSVLFIVLLLIPFFSKDAAKGCTLSVKEEIHTYPQENKGIFVLGNNHFILSSWKDIYEEKTLYADFDKDGEKETIIVGADHPNGTRVVGMKGKYGVDLLQFNTEDFFDAEGNINKNCFIQTSYFDLDNDGKDEVLISLSDKTMGVMKTAIYRVRNAEEASFKLVGVIDEQYKMYLEDNHIIVPYGSQGLFGEYMYDKGILFEAIHGEW